MATGSASIPALAALGALFGCGDAAYLPAQQALLPDAVGAERLPSANALLQGTLQLASIVGVVVALAGTGTAFAVDAASFAEAAALVALIAAGALVTAKAATDGPATPSSVAAAEPGEFFRAALAGGIRYVAADAGSAR